MYVRQPIKQPLVGWCNDGVPTLVWTTARSVFVAADGSTRDLYGLDYAEAKTLCTLKDVRFVDQSNGVDLDALW